MLFDRFPYRIDSIRIVNTFPVLVASAIPIAEDGVTQLNGVTQLVEDQGVEAILVHVSPNVVVDIVPCVHELGLELVDVIILEMDLL